MHQKLRLAHRNAKVFIGLEDSKKTWKLTTIDENGHVQRNSMSADFGFLLPFLQKRYAGREDQILIIYEAGMRGFVLCRQLRGAGYLCEVVPPHKVVQQKITKVKTDVLDSRLLADMGRNGLKDACEVPSEEREDDRQISRELEKIKRDMRRSRCGIRSKLLASGIDFPFEPGSWTIAHMDFLRNLQCRPGLRLTISSEIAFLDMLMAQQKILLKALRELCKTERYAKYVAIGISLPGVGWYTVIRLLLELGVNLDRFSNERQIAAYLGLVASEYSTGESIRRGRITGLGSKVMRAWLVQSAWVAIGRDETLYQKYQRVWKNSGSKKKAVVAVARVLIVRFRACIVSGKKYALTPLAAAA